MNKNKLSRLSLLGGLGRSLLRSVVVRGAVRTAELAVTRVSNARNDVAVRGEALVDSRQVEGDVRMLLYQAIQTVYIKINK